MSYSFSYFLKAGVPMVVRMSVRRRFQAAGPATLEARSPKFNDVRGTSKALYYLCLKHDERKIVKKTKRHWLKKCSWLHLCISRHCLPPIYPAKVVASNAIIIAALCNSSGHYIFALSFLSSSFFYLFPSPNLSGRRLDVCHTSTHGVALVRI